MSEEIKENLNTENIETTSIESIELAIPSANVSEVIIGDETVMAGSSIDTRSRKEFNTRGSKGTKSGTRPPRSPREKPEFDSKTIDVRRVTRVVSGGRRFSLSVAVALGDKNGKIGFGTGKALDTQAAIEKATKAAKKNMFTVKLNKNKSIPHDIEVKYKSGQI
jgi:hypothetical protein